jgi:hypothetical protein
MRTHSRLADRSLATVLVATLCLPSTGEARGGDIPAFARRYGVSCSLCHNPLPVLTPFGETFAANGYRMSPEEQPTDTLNTGDELLWLLRDVPLALRLDAYINAYGNGKAASDFQTPYNLKLLSGGPISSRLSYYLYFFLFERGEVGGIEDAFLYANDLFGAPVDLAIGQFQVSDPLFKRELRLAYQDYAIYRARIGDQPADLTYDRGLMAMADLAGFTITGIVVNGNGRGEAGANRRLDNDVPKNFMGHLTRDVLAGVRLGVLGYRGQQDGAVGTGPVVTNTLWMVGADATLHRGPLELNTQYLHREDDRPTFTIGEPRAVTDGGFAELLVRPAEGRWYGLLLYNRVVTNRPLLDVRLGGPAGLRRYDTLTGGAGFLWRRNFRIYGELTGDLDVKALVWTLGVTTAF